MIKYVYPGPDSDIEKVLANMDVLAAEFAALPDKEQEINQRAWDNYRTYIATIETAENRGILKGRKEGQIEGRNEGRIEGKLEIALKMKQRGDTIEAIVELTGLSIEVIKNL